MHSQSPQYLDLAVSTGQMWLASVTAINIQSNPSPLTSDKKLVKSNLGWYWLTIIALKVGPGRAPCSAVGACDATRQLGSVPAHSIHIPRLQKTSATSSAADRLPPSAQTASQLAVSQAPSCQWASGRR